MPRKRIYRFRNAWGLTVWACLGMGFLCLALPQQVLAVPRMIAVSPTSLVQSCPRGQNAPSQSFEVWDSGGSALTYAISANVAWVSVTRTGGTSAGEHDTITVKYSTAALGTGKYSAIINITAQSTNNSPVQVPVELTVFAVPPPGLLLLMD
jgi:hypothetical protein